MADRYVHKDHKSHPCSKAEMLSWMGKSRQEQMVWAIFDVLTADQQAKVLAHFGWKRVATEETA